MHYEVCSNMEELEPRITPKPTVKFNHFATPVVPEVSLIFDKPTDNTNHNYGHTHTKSVPSSSDKQKPYATWKEVNFSWKTTQPISVDSFTSPKERFYQNSSGHYQELEHPSPSKNDDVPAANHNCRQERKLQIMNTDYSNNKRNLTAQGHCVNSINKYYNNGVRNMEEVLSVSVPVCSSRTYQDAKNSENRVHVPQSQDVYALHQNSNNNTNMDFHNNQRIYTRSNSMGDGNMANPHVAFPHPCCDGKSSSLPLMYSTNCFNNSIDNGETVKNLLQLVNTQSEQIKILQLQVDRLIKMQEKNMKEKAKCSCSSQAMHQDRQMCIDSYDTVGQIISQNKYMKNDAYHNEDGTENVIEKNKENFSGSKLGNQSDFNPQVRKTFMEQKVSIGVMTSFELTMQNKPYILDTEDLDKHEVQQNEMQTNRDGMNLRDTPESIRKNKSSFTRLPGVQLENIVEDSESYLSSSQQYSSNLNASCSTKDLQEKQNHVDSHKELDNRNLQNRIESPKTRIRKDIKTDSVSIQKIDNKKYMGNMCANEASAEKMNLLPNTPVDHLQYAPRALVNSKMKGINNRGNECTVFDIQDKSAFQRHMELDHCNGSTNGKHSDNMKQSDCIDHSMVLTREDFRIDDRQPTPEPSIHVEMQEYSSDDESEKIKRTSKIGWTFYNNVLGQVNQILQDSCPVDTEQKTVKAANNVDCKETDKVVLDSVKIATLEQLRKLGISLTETGEPRDTIGNKNIEFDGSYYPRLDYQGNMAHSAMSETNTSLHMKALALKYLNDEQLAELAIQKQGSASMKQVMLSNMQGTNMSFATMRYLERYQLLPSRNNVQNEGIPMGKTGAEMIPKSDINTGNIKHNPVVQRYPLVQTSRTTCPSKILDISTLKQQPKLL